MLRLTDSTRAALKAPLGELMDISSFIKRHGSSRIISVGDIVTLSLLERGIKPAIAVYDFKTKREVIDKEGQARISSAFPHPERVTNPPGTISPELEKAASRTLGHGSGGIFIDGEDDLATLVFMATCPEGYVIIYGQPDAGVVAVECSENKRNEAKRIMEKMEGP